MLQMLGFDVALEDLEETFLSALETIEHIYNGRILRLMYLKYRSRLRSDIAVESLLFHRQIHSHPLISASSQPR